MEKRDTLRIAMVMSNSEDVEWISNHFRNSGIAVRSYHVQNMNELKSSLDYNLTLIISDNSKDDLSVRSISNTIKSAGKDIPIITLNSIYNEDVVFKDLVEGARFCCPLKNIKFIEMIVLKEWNDLIARCNSNQLTEQLMETNKRCDALIDSSRDAIAYIHEGMHISANVPYMQLFGVEDFEEMEATSLLDLIAASDLEMFKKFLKQKSKEAVTQKINVKVKKFNKEEIEVEMELSSAIYEGESCIQIMVRVMDTVTEIIVDNPNGILSRTNFLEEIMKNTKDNQPKTLLLCSPENYDQVFNNLSLTAVDQLLTGFIEHLKINLPDEVIIGQTGEAQYGVLLTNEQVNNINEFCSSLHNEFKDFMLTINSNSMLVPAKVVGINWRRPSPENSEMILSEAIKVLNSHKNGFHVIDAGQTLNSKMSSSLVTDKIVSALESERIRISFSPITALHGSNFTFYSINSALFEESGSNIEISENIPSDVSMKWQRYRIEKICKILSEQNLSPNSKILLPMPLTDENSWIDFLPEVLNKYKLQTQLFIIELQESQVFTKIKLGQEIVHKFKSIGMEIGLGSFGDIPQSSAVMQHLNPQWIRLSTNLTKELSTSSEKQVKLTELTTIAKESGKKVIAPDVQDAMSMAVLYGAQVEYAQGEFLMQTIKIVN